MLTSAVVQFFRSYCWAILVAELHETKVIKDHLQPSFFSVLIILDKSVSGFYTMKIDVKYLDSIILKSLHSITIKNVDTKYEKY